MPTYSYLCTDCDHAFDTVQSFSDDALTECPECAGRLRKQFNAVGVVFKGGGFYRTDSRSGGSGSSGSGSSGSGGGSASGSDGSASSSATGSSTSTSSGGAGAATSGSAGSSTTSGSSTT